MAAIRTNPYNDPNYLGGGYYFGTGNDQLPGGGWLNTIGNGGKLFDPGGVDLFGNIQGLSDDDLLSMFGFDQGADVPENPDSWWNESMWGSFNPDPGSGGNNGTNPGGGNGAGSGTGCCSRRHLTSLICRLISNTWGQVRLGRSRGFGIS